jgi:hypothetical protein
MGNIFLTFLVVNLNSRQHDVSGFGKTLMDCYPAINVIISDVAIKFIIEKKAS